MFGYVRPLKKALAEEDSARYQAAYCGLCRVIGARYGRIAQSFLNYDFAFLAMLLAEQPQSPCIDCRRCPVYLWRKKDAWEADAGLELAAAESVVLLYWKIRDGIVDEGVWKAGALRLLCVLLRPGYRRAAAQCPDFAETVQGCLFELREIELAKTASLDRPADAFARLLQAASGRHGKPGAAALSQLLYHVGRWIYLIDARDDFDDDCKSGNYNPLVLLGLQESEEGRAQLDETLSASLAMAQDAFAWLDTGLWSPVLENIILLGLPGMQEAVLSGAWRNRRKKRNLRRSGDD